MRGFLVQQIRSEDVQIIINFLTKELVLYKRAPKKSQFINDSDTNITYDNSRKCLCDLKNNNRVK